MAYQQEGQFAQVPSPVAKVAQLIRLFSRQEKVQLLKLVPDLQTIQIEEDVEIPVEQRELVAYFEKKLAAYPASHIMQSDAYFLDGLTVAEFFALDEAEQARIWSEAHTNAAEELAGDESPVRIDAVPTR